MVDIRIKERVGKCPLSKWQFLDAMVSSLGDYECNCSERSNELGEHGGPGDRPSCDSSSYLSCEWYKKSLGKYSSVVGEFHKLGNLEDRGFFLPEVTLYDREQSSISVKESPRRRRKLGEIKDGKVYVGKPSAHCLAIAKEMRRKPRYPQGYCK